jgi:glycine reductase
MIRVVHYINQFYGGIGGEDKADYRPEIREGFAGPGMGLKNLLAPEAEIVATVVCGDTYFTENMEEATAKILDLIAAYQPDIFIAGPAFNAGRYGVACGAIAKAVKDKFKIPVVSAMYRENPGADMYKKDVIMAETTNSAAGMRKALPNLAKLSLKLAKHEELGSPQADKYLAQGLRKNIFLEKRGATRAVEMLVKKLRGEEFNTEFEMPNFDRVEPFAAVKDIKHAKIALVTSGGIVPKGNPDHIEASSASRYGKYDIKHILNMTEESHETAHGGYDPVYANSDSDCVLPVDVLRDLENSGEIGELHRYFYSTTGNGTAVADAKRWGAEIAKELVADGVTAVILTST